MPSSHLRVMERFSTSGAWGGEFSKQTVRYKEAADRAGKRRLKAIGAVSKKMIPGAQY